MNRKSYIVLSRIPETGQTLVAGPVKGKENRDAVLRECKKNRPKWKHWDVCVGTMSREV